MPASKVNGYNWRHLVSKAKKCNTDALLHLERALREPDNAMRSQHLALAAAKLGVQAGDLNALETGTWRET